MEPIDRQSVLNKEIDLIQGCINRMAHNSFVVKGWLISLIAVVLGLFSKNFNINLLCLICLIITWCFWYLDGFFLKTERLYRWKYEWIIKKRLTTDENCYNLNPYEESMWLKNKDGQARKKPKILRIMFTKTLTPIYLPMVVLIIFMFVNSFTKWI